MTLHVEGFAQRINLAMQLLSGSQDEIREYLTTVEHAHAAGPFLDPTAYRDALYRGDMDALAAVCRDLLPAIKTWDEKVKPKIPAEMT